MLAAAASVNRHSICVAVSFDDYVKGITHTWKIHKKIAKILNSTTMGLWIIASYSSRKIQQQSARMCSRRYFLLFVCTLQLVRTSKREVVVLTGKRDRVNHLHLARKNVSTNVYKSRRPWLCWNISLSYFLLCLKVHNFFSDCNGRERRECENGGGREKKSRAEKDIQFISNILLPSRDPWNICDIKCFLCSPWRKIWNL